MQLKHTLNVAFVWNVGWLIHSKTRTWNMVSVALTHTRRHLVGVFRDVVFQDVGFERNTVNPLTHISYRCEVPTPSVVEGQSISIFTPPILKHHIPELLLRPLLWCSASTIAITITSIIISIMIYSIGSSCMFSVTREFTMGGLVKGGLAIRHVFNFHI